MIFESHLLHHFPHLPPEALLCHLQLWNPISKKNGCSLSWHFKRAYSTALLLDFIFLAFSLKGRFPGVVNADDAFFLWLLFKREYKPPDILARTILLALSKVVCMSDDELTEFEVP